MSRVDPFDASNLPEFEKQLPENTPDAPEAIAWVVTSTLSTKPPTNGSSHSVPTNLPKNPLPNEDFWDPNRYQPSAFNLYIDAEDEYLQTIFDESGERKISKNGWFYDHSMQERILITTFTLPGRGKKLFCLATDISKELLYRDLYLFLNRNKSVFKHAINESDKSFLIDQGILPTVFKSRPTGVVTFRSVYLIYGARLLKHGTRLTDDYWESTGRELGFTESDTVFPDGYKFTDFEITVLKGDPEKLKREYEKPGAKMVSSSSDSKGARFTVESFQNIPINYSRLDQLESFLIAEPSDETKQNYLLSLGVTTTPIYSKPAFMEGTAEISTQPKVTLPGGSTPPSITSSLLNSEPLISTNGDNIYAVSALQTLGIVGEVKVSEKAVVPNYNKITRNLTTDITKLDELIKTFPIASEAQYLGKVSNTGLRFNSFGSVVEKITRPAQGTGIEKAVPNSSGGYDIVGGGAKVKRLRQWDYMHNAVSVNQGIAKSRKTRRDQWLYYWFKKAGGFKLYTKTLKKGYKKANPPVQQRIEKEGRYFKYVVVPKNDVSMSFFQEDDDAVVLDLNEDSDVEVLDEAVRPWSQTDVVTNQARVKLTEQRNRIVEEFRQEKIAQFRAQQEAQAMAGNMGFNPLSEPMINLNELQFQTMMKMKILKRADANANTLDTPIEE